MSLIAALATWFLLAAIMQPQLWSGQFWIGIVAAVFVGWVVGLFYKKDR